MLSVVGAVVGGGGVVGGVVGGGAAVGAVIVGVITGPRCCSRR